jgi:hypothetical protein
MACTGWKLDGDEPASLCSDISPDGIGPRTLPRTNSGGGSTEGMGGDGGAGDLRGDGIRELVLAQGREMGRLHGRFEKLNGKMNLLLDTFEEQALAATRSRNQVPTYSHSQPSHMRALYPLSCTLEPPV